MSPAYGVCLFCDDIRFEQQNKFTLVGCYGPDLIVSEPLPLLLPKLCVLIQIRMPPARTPAIKLTITVPGASEPIWSHFEEEEKQDFVSSISKDDLAKGLEPIRGALIPAIFAPFPVQEFGFVRVRMEYGSETIKIGALHIRHRDSQPNTVSPASTATQPPS